MAVLPKIELFEAALWAVSPDGANKLVLLFAGCSGATLAFRPEKRPAPLEVGGAEDWPKSDMARGGQGGLVRAQEAKSLQLFASCLRDRVGKTCRRVPAFPFRDWGSRLAERMSTLECVSLQANYSRPIHTCPASVCCTYRFRMF